ncbi:MAG: 3-hydroxyacyl-CoA dehydrogenase NAD-binding domain-containing protein [Chloroflexota bacterium]
MTIAIETIPRPGITLRREGDLGICLIDLPGKVNVIDEPFVDAFEQALDELPNDLRGLIVTSGKDTQFIAGADLRQLVAARAEGDRGMEHLENIVRRLQRSLNRLATLPYPTAAAINGAALGGGLEVALACSYRVVVRSDAPLLGLPEVQLGLIPAGGGTQRLPRMVGLSRGLPLLLQGKRVTPRRALQLGLVDEVVHPAVLLDAARKLVGAGNVPRRSRQTVIDRLAEHVAMVRRGIYRRAAQTINRTGPHYPAPRLILEAVRAGQEQGIGAGLAAEAAFFVHLAAENPRLIEIFLAGEDLKREARRADEVAKPIARVGVIGAGLMGSGIAQAAAVAGYAVRVRDIEPDSVGRGLKRARDLTTRARRSGRFSCVEANNILSRLSGGTDYGAFQHVDLAIEAVFESLETKRRVLSELEERVGVDVVIASNTSSVPISEIATGAKHPERVVGMHFFSPVHKMPLLEVVAPAAASSQAVATAVTAGRRMGKTVIVVGDGAGFYTTRVLALMMQEAGHLFEAGLDVDEIDRAMLAFGFPIGPLAEIDEVGIDLAAHISDVLRNAFPHRFTGPSMLQQMVDAGRLGKKVGAGFYRYEKGKRRSDRNVRRLARARHTKLPRDLIQRRLVLLLANEAVGCLDEGILACPRDGDIGAVMGFGFPPYQGGPFRYMDQMGIQQVVDELEKFANAYGAAFEPAPLLRRMAAEGRRFYEG